LKDLLPSSFWPKGSTSHFVEKCAESKQLTDLALRIWQCQESEHLEKIVDDLCQQGKSIDLFKLARTCLEIDPDLYKTIESTLNKKMNELMNQLKNALKNDSAFPETNLLSLISKNWKMRNLEHPVWDAIAKIFDQREKYAAGIEADHRKGEKGKVSKKLINLCLWEGRLLESERLLGEYDLLSKTPSHFIERFNTRLKDEQLETLSQQLFNQSKIPQNYNQRVQVFQYLFSKNFFHKKLDDALKTKFESWFEKAQKSFPNLNIDWIRCKSRQEAKKKKMQLQLWQCLLPPHALCNFVAAFLEFQYIEPNADLEQRLNALNQAELQLPSLELTLASPATYRKKIWAYQQGLQKKISEAKFQAYLKDDRTSNAFEQYIEAVFNNWEWTQSVFPKQPELILNELKQLKPEEPYYHITHHLHKHFGSDSKVQSHVQNTIEQYKKFFTQVNANNSITQNLSGLGHLYRAISLGHPIKESQALLEQYRDLLEEQRRDNVQSLSRDLGSVLGEAFSMQPGQDVPGSSEGETNDQFERLYEQFRDVMLQQDPFAKDTEENLSQILEQAQKLIAEAKSIDAKKSVTAFQNMMSGKDEKGKDLFIDKPPSITSLIGELYLGQEPLRDTSKKASRRPIVPEQAMFERYSEFLFHLVSSQILKENNPLLKHIGDDLLKFIDFGHPSPEFWKSEEVKKQVSETFPNLPHESKILVTERFVICNVSEWLRFENQEALKVPFRKAMAIVCSNITNGIVLCRDKAQKTLEEMVDMLKSIDPNPMIIDILKQMRKASQQINAIDCMKSGGILPIKFDRSIEPRVRGFLSKMTETLQNFGPKVMAVHDKYLPTIYALDKAEFQLGSYLNEKETTLKRYLHMNLEEMTKNHLRESSKNSIQTRISNSCIRVQQGINFKRSDQRNLRFPLVVNEESPYHTVEDVEKHMRAFEENFPIIDRISGSRQNIDESTLIFNIEDYALKANGFSEYKEHVQKYQENSLKLARQLRIMIMPGQGTGNYESQNHALCIPLYTGKGRTIKMSLISALADYLYNVKIKPDTNKIEDTILEVLNKKSKRPLKPGSHDAQLKLTQLIYQELGTLAGVEKVAPNPNNISDLLSKAILGSDMTMIYRDLRDLSAPQKSQRYNYLKIRYNVDKKAKKMGDKIKEVALTYYASADITDQLKASEFTKVYHGLNENDQGVIKDEIYDLAVLLYHYDEYDDAYDFFDILTKLDPQFPEPFWGLATTCRHAALTRVSSTERTSIAITSYKRFSSFNSVGPFWRKRADQLSKKLIEES
jgi:hypothetical protein